MEEDFTDALTAVFGGDGEEAGQPAAHGVQQRPTAPRTVDT